MEETDDSIGLQLAPEDGEAPDFEELKQGLSQAVLSMQDFIDQRQRSYETRHALWDGQTQDGKKHKREGSKITPTPWDGASDIQVFLVDEAINAQVALLMQAWRSSTLVAVPIQGADAPRARVVSQFLKWLCNSQIPNMDREVELLANIWLQDGLAVTGQFWEEKQERVLKKIRVSDMPPEMQAQLANPELKDVFVQLAAQSFSISERRAKKMLKELIATGEAGVPGLGKRISRPVFRTFSLGENLFIHSAATDIENAPAIYRVEYYTPEQLRSFALNDGFDDEWVEEAIEKLRGQQVTILPDAQGGLTRLANPGQTNKYDDLIGVVYAYQRLSDEDGYPGVYCTVFNPALPPCDEHDGYAKTGLLGDEHGEYPFKLHRREFLDRGLYATRGIPEIGKPFQDQMKVCVDARIDASSLSVLPPLLYPQGRAPSQWGPGARVPERRPNEYHYADRPTYDITTTKVEERLSMAWREYLGMVTPEGDQQLAAAKKRVMIEKFLSGIADSLRQVFSLWKQYGDEQTFFRVVGTGQNDPQRVEKGSIDETYDFFVTFNQLAASDPEAFERIVTSLAQMIQTFDKYGQTDYSELLTLVVSAIDPSIADRIISPKENATQRTVKEVKDTISRAAAGFDESIDLNTPPDIGMQVIQQFTQAPDVQAKLSADQAYRERIEKIAKQFQFQATQQQNAVIGRYGA